MRGYTSLLSSSLMCEGTIIINLFFSVSPGIFPTPLQRAFVTQRTCSSSEGDRRGLSRVLLLDALHSCFIGKLRASSSSTTVSGRYLRRALYIPCQDHVASHSKPICRDTFTESHWAHFCQSKYPLAPNLTQSTESESTLPSVCRKDHARKWAENEILISPLSPLCCCLGWHSSLFPKRPGGSQPRQQEAYTPFGKNLCLKVSQWQHRDRRFLLNKG